MCGSCCSTRGPPKNSPTRMASSNISSGLLAGCRLHVPGLLSPIRPSRPSLAVGGLFVANYFVFQAIAWLGGLNQETSAAFDEVKETNYAFAFFVLDCVPRRRGGYAGGRAAPQTPNRQPELSRKPRIAVSACGASLSSRWSLAWPLRFNMMRSSESARSRSRGRARRACPGRGSGPEQGDVALEPELDLSQARELAARTSLRRSRLCAPRARGRCSAGGSEIAAGEAREQWKDESLERIP